MDIRFTMASVWHHRGITSRQFFLLTFVYICVNITLMWRKEDVIQKLREEQGDRPLREYAEEVGCSAATLSQIYSNNRNPGRKILKHFNLVTDVTYTEMKWRKE